MLILSSLKRESHACIAMSWLAQPLHPNGFHATPASIA